MERIKFRKERPFGVLGDLCPGNQFLVQYIILVLPKNETGVFLNRLDIKQTRPPGRFGGGRGVVRAGWEEGVTRYKYVLPDFQYA